MTEADPQKRRNRKIDEIIPPEIIGIQANSCRTLGCENFGKKLQKVIAPNGRKVWNYRLIGSIGETQLRCNSCGRHFRLYSNRALFYEVQRLFYFNNYLFDRSCRNEECDNHNNPLNLYPEEYHKHGKTSSGRKRYKCRRCGTSLVSNLDHKNQKLNRINIRIFEDIVNSASLTATARKLQISAKTLYERIDFIHRQCLAFEAVRLKELKRIDKFQNKEFFLSTDVQELRANWLKSDFRVPVQLPCVTTAENLTGFIFRTDVCHDPQVGNVGKHYLKLLENDDFYEVEGLGLSHRYNLPGFLWAASYDLQRMANITSEDIENGSVKRRLENEAHNLAAFCQANYPKGSLEHPLTGAIVKRSYTAIAHFLAICQVLPENVKLHVMTDADNSLLNGMKIGLKNRILKDQVDISSVVINKKLSTPQKKSRVGRFKQNLIRYVNSIMLHEGLSPEDIRNSFIIDFMKAVEPVTASMEGDWFSSPVQSLYEPDKCVGILHMTGEPSIERIANFVDYTSLHSVDSFFQMIRDRVSMFGRGNMSRSSGTVFSKKQPYTPEMVQKIMDISRVYYNWVEPRSHRLDRPTLTTNMNASEISDVIYGWFKRTKAKDKMETPAMRMGLAKGPVRMQKIVYGNWTNDVFK